MFRLVYLMLLAALYLVFGSAVSGLLSPIFLAISSGLMWSEIDVPVMSYIFLIHLSSENAQVFHGQLLEKIDSLEG